MRRYALRDDQWARIKEDILPGREGHVGVTTRDNRLFVEAVLYRYRAGRDLRSRLLRTYGCRRLICSAVSRLASVRVPLGQFRSVRCLRRCAGLWPHGPWGRMVGCRCRVGGCRGHGFPEPVVIARGEVEEGVADEGVSAGLLVAVSGALLADDAVHLRAVNSLRTLDRANGEQVGIASRRGVCQCGTDGR